MPTLSPPDYPDRPDKPLYAFGPCFGEEIGRSVVSCVFRGDPDHPREESVSVGASLTMLEAFRPEDHLSCMLAAEGVGFHVAAMDCLARANQRDIPVELMMKLRLCAVQMANAVSRVTRDVGRLRGLDWSGRRGRTRRGGAPDDDPGPPSAPNGTPRRAAEDIDPTGASAAAPPDRATAPPDRAPTPADPASRHPASPRSGPCHPEKSRPAPPGAESPGPAPPHAGPARREPKAQAQAAAAPRGVGVGTAEDTASAAGDDDGPYLVGPPVDIRTRPDGTPGSLVGYLKPEPPRPIPKDLAINRALRTRPSSFRQVNLPAAPDAESRLVAPPSATARGPVDIIEDTLRGDALACFAAARLDPNAPDPPADDDEDAIMELELIATGGDAEAEADRAALIAAHPMGQPIAVFRLGAAAPWSVAEPPASAVPAGTPAADPRAPPPAGTPAADPRVPPPAGTSPAGISAAGTSPAGTLAAGTSPAGTLAADLAVPPPAGTSAASEAGRDAADPAGTAPPTPCDGGLAATAARGVDAGRRTMPHDRIAAENSQPPDTS